MLEEQHQENHIFFNKELYAGRILSRILYVFGLILLVGVNIRSHIAEISLFALTISNILGVTFLALAYSAQKNLHSKKLRHAAIVLISTIIVIIPMKGIGFQAAIFSTFSIVPFLATFLLGYRGGILYTLLSVGLLTLAYWLHWQDLFGQKTIAFSRFIHVKVIVLNLVVVFSLIVALIYERGRNLVDQDLNQMNLALSEKRNLLREKNQELEKISQAKSEFLNNMSHELRTPLNAIIGYSEILLESTDENDPAQQRRIKDIDNILMSGHHLLNMVNDILDFSKSDSGTLNLVLGKGSVGQLVDEVVTVVDPILKTNRNNLSIRLESKAIELSTDLKRTKQILINLLSNAGKFTSRGSIILSANSIERKGISGVSFVVEDSGTGISSLDLTRIFEKFVQCHDINTQNLAGTGLGLPLTKNLVERLGGSIEVESELGHGSKFKVFIPSVTQFPKAG